MIVSLGSLTMTLILTSNVDDTPADLQLAGEGGQTYRMLKFVMSSFGLDSVPLTEGSILDPFCEVWE
jgi:hypothetical protein